MIILSDFLYASDEEFDLMMEEMERINKEINGKYEVGDFFILRSDHDKNDGYPLKIIYKDKKKYILRTSHIAEIEMTEDVLDLIYEKIGHCE